MFTSTDGMKRQLTRGRRVPNIRLIDSAQNEVNRQNQNNHEIHLEIHPLIQRRRFRRLRLVPMIQMLRAASHSLDGVCP